MKLTVPTLATPASTTADLDRQWHDAQTAALLEEIDTLLAEAKSLSSLSSGMAAGWPSR